MWLTACYKGDTRQLWEERFLFDKQNKKEKKEFLLDIFNLEKIHIILDTDR